MSRTKVIPYIFGSSRTRSPRTAATTPAFRLITQRFVPGTGKSVMLNGLPSGPTIASITRTRTIPRSRHDPKILRIDDAKVVGDRITQVRPIPGNFFAQETECRVGELGAVTRGGSSLISSRRGARAFR